MRRGEGGQSSKEICLIHRRYVYSWAKLHHVKKIKVLLSPFSCTGRSRRCQKRQMGCVSWLISYCKSFIKKPAHVVYKQDEKGRWPRRKGWLVSVWTVRRYIPTAIVQFLHLHHPMWGLSWPRVTAALKLWGQQANTGPESPALFRGPRVLLVYITICVPVGWSIQKHQPSKKKN